MKRKLYWIEKSDIIVVLVLVQVGFFLSVMKQRKHVMCFRDHSQSLHDWIAGKYMCCSGIKREGGRNSCVCFNLIYILVLIYLYRKNGMDYGGIIIIIIIIIMFVDDDSFTSLFGIFDSFLCIIYTLL
jgi:hypothetical protein